MRVCLVTAPVATEFKGRDEIDSCVDEPAVSGPQLGILSLAAVLEARKHAVSIVDLDQAYLAHLDSPDRDRSFAEVAASFVAAKDVDVYGFSSLCSSYPLTIRIAQTLKTCRPTSVILLGGPQATVVDLPTLAAFPFIDFILRGEAETTLPLLLDELSGQGTVSRVPGLSYRYHSQPHRNASAPIIEDLDALPTPAYHLAGIQSSAPRLSLELGRGCPFACTFCSTNDFFRRNFRLRSPERVIRDMRKIAHTYGIRQFELVHDMFTVDRRRVVSFCEAMLACGDGFTWSCSARTDCVDEQLLDLMSRAGCVGIFYGVEAGSPRLQRIIDKHLDVERVRQIVDATERLGMRSTVSLITGFPEETIDDLRHTLRMYMFSARHPESTPQLNILAPLAATPVHMKYREQMTLGELCSEMSQQGVSLDQDDRKLIEEHPEIFPNFYLLPTPHLERACLLELREFALNGLGHFRWLLCAIDQTTQELYEFFLAWRTHRLRIRTGLTGPELRRYYKSSNFRTDFLRFVESSCAGRSRTVRALVEFEMAWSSATGSLVREVTTSQTVSEGMAVSARQMPVRSPDTQLIELSCDIQKLIDALKRGVAPIWESGPHFYVTLSSPTSLKRLYGISRELGRLLQVCDGQHTVEDIVEGLAQEFTDIETMHREATILGLIGAAVQEGLLIHPASIQRPSLAPGASSQTTVAPAATSD